MNPVIFRDASAKKDFFMYSAMTSDLKEKIKGVEYYVIRLDISSASHPFFTGKQSLIDTSGRVEKFEARMAKARSKSHGKEQEESNDKK